MQWVQVLSEGWAYPLRGFMTEDEYLQSLHFNSLTRDGVVYNQSVPIVLSCSSQERDNLKDHQKIVLEFEGKHIAVLNNITTYPHRKEERCARQFGLYNVRHPYQKYIDEDCGDWLIGGELKVFERITWNDGLDQYRLTPFELKKRFKEINVNIQNLNFFSKICLF